MIASLWRAHRGQTFFYYLDVSLEETLRRHATGPQATEFSADDMRGWYQPADLLGFGEEHTIQESSSFEESIVYIATTARLPLAPAMSA
jgi:hypothetical protein